MKGRIPYANNIAPSSMSKSELPASTADAENARLQSKYWNGTLLRMLALLAIWAIAGLGCGILFADTLNEFSIGGFPLGFWFAQQGSIIVFVFVILAFCILMNRRERDEVSAIRDRKEKRK